MSNDWQPGDLALSVEKGWSKIDRTERGRIYVVEAVWHHEVDNDLAFSFVGVDCGDPQGDDVDFYGFNPARFIKVTPLEADEFDREVIDLLRQKELAA